MSKFTDLINKGAALVKGDAIPYTYKVGEKGTGKGVPFDVKLSIDQDFKNTVLKSVAMIAGGIALGTAVGIFISRNKK